MGAPRRADSMTLSSASVIENTSKPAGWGSWLMSEKRSAIGRSIALGLVEQPVHQLSRSRCAALVCVAAHIGLWGLRRSLGRCRSGGSANRSEPMTSSLHRSDPMHVEKRQAHSVCLDARDF